MNEEIVGKIKRLRIAKGLNQSFVADRLNITRSAYQKLESGESYAWAKYLDKLMDVLKITPKEFFSDIGHKIIHQNNFKESAVGYVETLYQENREIYEKLLASKDEQITFLKNLLDKNIEIG
jgi:transcriptional regulator with XRE-family HTH domain